MIYVHGWCKVVKWGYKEQSADCRCASGPVITGSGEMDEPGEDEQREAAREAGDPGDAGAMKGEGAPATAPRGAGTTESDRRIEEILTAAELRDDQADMRDSEAYRQDMAANLDAFVRRVDDDEAYRARARAAKDRAHSRADRVASKLDRHLLTGLSPNAEEREEAAPPEGPDAADGAEDSDDTGSDGGTGGGS
jgi:hypothetical protein